MNLHYSSGQASIAETKPKVSICLPVFNGARHLSLAIESILNQSATNWELLISDDGSTDDSWQIIENFANKDDRIKYWQNEKRLGLFENYNFCMQQASAPLIKLFAQDDILDLRAIKKMQRVFEERPNVVLVACAKNLVDLEGNNTVIGSDDEEKICQAFPEDTELSGSEVIAETIVKPINWIGEPCTVMFRSRCIGDGFDYQFKQLGDLDYWYRMLRTGDYYYLSERLCKYRWHRNSTSFANHFNLNSLADVFMLAVKHRKQLGKIGVSLSGYCQEKIQAYADWVRHLVDKKYELLFPELAFEILEMDLDLDSVGETNKDTIENLLVFTYRFMAFNAITLFSRAKEREIHLQSEANRLHHLHSVVSAEKEKIQEDKDKLEVDKGKLEADKERLEEDFVSYKLQLNNSTKRNSFIPLFSKNKSAK